MAGCSAGGIVTGIATDAEGGFSAVISGTGDIGIGAGGVVGTTAGAGVGAGGVVGTTAGAGVGGVASIGGLACGGVTCGGAASTGAGLLTADSVGCLISLVTDTGTATGVAT